MRVAHFKSSTNRQVACGLKRATALSLNLYLIVGGIQLSPKALFEAMTGKWRGECRTWFEPGKFADQSAVTGTIEGVFDHRFLRHTYQATIQGKPRHRLVTGTGQANHL